jgi:pimeloyl-ACP methyl ester carboxylesterase
MDPRQSLSVFALAAGLLLPGCAEDSASIATDGVRNRASPVVVTLGGFNSCAVGPQGPTPRSTDRWTRSEALSNRFGGSDPRWVRACFDRASRLHFVSSANPAVVRTTTLDALGPFFDSIASLTEGAAHPLYVQGHSYGGWLGMYLVWYLPQSTDVRLLFAVDPISPAHCTVSSYLLALSTAGTSLAGCQRAPSDFSAADRRYLRQRVRDGGWRHYFQRNFLPLRSSAYSDGAEPHRSYDLSPFLNRNGARPSWNAHGGIAELSVVWYSFEASIATDLGL